MQDYADVVLAAALKTGQELHQLVVELSAGDNNPVEIQMAGPVFGVVQEVIRGIRDGTKMTHVYDDVMRLTSNQEARAELIDQLMLSHDFTRYADFVAARDDIETDLLLACKRQQLNPIEKVALYREITKIVTGLENRIRGQTSSVKDIVSQLQKVDYAVNASSTAELQKRFANTSPQAREVTRKLLTKLRKAVTPPVDAEVVGSEAA